MRILHIYDEHMRVWKDQGSVPVAIFYLAKYASEMGHDVVVLERLRGDLPPEEYTDGIKFIRVRAKEIASVSHKEIKSPLGILRLVLDKVLLATKFNKMVRNENFDVIHVHLPFTANIFVTLDKKIGNKMVYTAHIGEEKKRFKLDSNETHSILRFFSPDIYLMKRVKKTVVLNEQLKNKLIRLGKIEQKKITVIGNGVDTKELAPTKVSDELKGKAKEKYKIFENRTVIFFSGIINRRKGVEYLVKAADILINKLSYKELMFILSGDPKIDEVFTKNIISFIKRRKLERHVKLLGFIPYEDLKVLYSICDIFVLPSLEEGFGIALTNALSFGKPVIGTKVGGIPMQIIDGWNGFLVEPSNEKQLAEKIAYLVDNDEIRRVMGVRSRRLAEREFDWKKITEKYLDVYEEVARK